MNSLAQYQAFQQCLLKLFDSIQGLTVRNTTSTSGIIAYRQHVCLHTFSGILNVYYLRPYEDLSDKGCPDYLMTWRDQSWNDLGLNSPAACAEDLAERVGSTLLDRATDR